MKIFEKGLLRTIILAFIVLSVFYGKLLWHCNTVYFGDSMDPMQAYYSAIYHLTYDKSYFHTGGMNYPYGENVFFTGGYIPIVFFLKLLNHIINTSAYTLGIINLFMLLSIVVCAASIYLIFRELKLPSLYSTLASVGIAFISPQLQRLGGPLSFEFVIPLFMYLLIKFYQNPTLKKSIFISLFTFFGITSHFYFFTFFCFISFFYWAALFFSHEKDFSRIGFVIKHFFLQIVLPFILLNIIMAVTNHDNDRTHYPWGFFEYTSSWLGVLFPYGKPYENIARLLYKPHSSPGWEGIVYLGMVAIFLFIVLLVIALKKVLTGKFSQLGAVTDNKILNIFFWAGIVALLYSFGYPFIWKKDFFIHYIGPLKEIRALGRCAWLFLYVMNIVAFYLIYYWVKNKNIIIKYGILSVSIVLLFSDVYFYINHHEDSLNANIEELLDKDNNLPVNNWLKTVNLNQYQAIIPLPYFHVGSENVWLSPESDIFKYVLIVSLKSGLPTTAVTMSRTSLSQTYKNICLVLEPYRSLTILKDLPNTKPFLVMAQPDKINDMEKHLLSKCKYLLQTPKYSVYELDYSTLQHYTDSLYAETDNDFKKIKTFRIGDYYSTDSVKNFIHFDYEETPNPISYQGKGAYVGNYSEYNVLYQGTVPNYKDSNYIFSFWMYNFTTDLYPRGTIEIAELDSAGNLLSSMNYTAPQKILKALDGKWALLEEQVKIRHASDKIKITLWNSDLKKNAQVIYDEFWLKPLSTNIYQEGTDYIFKNNRFYKQ